MKKNWRFTETNYCRFSQKLQRTRKLVLTKYWYCQNLISANINLLEIGSIMLPCTWNTFKQIKNKKDNAKELFSCSIFIISIISIYLSVYLSLSLSMYMYVYIYCIKVIYIFMASWQLVYIGHLMYRFACHVSQV